MLRVNIYIPEAIDDKLELMASATGLKKAEIVRNALEEGIKVIHPKSVSAQALLNLAREAEKIPTVGKVPKDAIKNMDYYTWGGAKR